MAFTGLNFSDQIDIISDLAYGTYFDPAKKNSLIKESLIKMVSLKYAGLDTQAEYDELYQFIKTKSSFIATNNSIDISPVGVIQDYMHLLAIRPVFSVPTSVIIDGATNATPIVIQLDRKTMLRDGSYVLLAGATQNTSINGYRYLRQVNSYKYALYLDSNLLVPVPGNGTTAGTITLNIVHQNSFCTQYKSGEKGTGFMVPTLYRPMFEIANGLIKLYPDNETCNSAYIDYIKKPLDSQLPDITNNVIDLENTYSLRFLYYWADQVVKTYGEIMREYNVVQMQDREIINP